jgi:DNA-binding response OmpR family regulator
MNRIVVIEDDPAILSGLEATLRSEYLTCCTAGHNLPIAEEAVGAAQRFSNGNFEDDPTVVSITVD